MSKITLSSPNAPIALVDYALRGFANEVIYYLVAPGHIEQARQSVSDLNDDPNAVVSLYLLAESPESELIAKRIVESWNLIPVTYWEKICKEKRTYTWEWNPCLSLASMTQ